MKGKLLQSTDPNAPDFDYEKWKKENNITPAISIDIKIPKADGEESEDEEGESEDGEEMDDEMMNDSDPEEYKKFLAENNVKPAKETISNTLNSLFKKKKRDI